VHSYNRINGTYACENPITLGDLKNPRGLNFSGWVLTDWEGAHSTVAAALSGMDQEMPNSIFFGSALESAVESGEVSEARLNDMAMRVLVPMFRAGLFDGAGQGGFEDANVTSDAHNSLARELAAAGTVLLKNSGGVLPLMASTVKSILVLGDACDKAPICCGTGSGAVLPPYVITPLQGIKARALEVGISNVTYLRSPSSEAGINATAASAKLFDAVVMCFGSPSGEGNDRPSLSLAPLDDALAAAVTLVQPVSVVTLQNPGAVLIPWADSAAAILATWFSGQEMGSALSDILFGDVNPSGRLPVTFPMNASDTPMRSPTQYPGVGGVVEYTERLNIGYKWWDSSGVTPRFPFGHGLSYTTFQYSPIELGAEQLSGVVVISFNVTNSGSVKGKEVAQLYLTFPQAASEPPLNLRDFFCTPSLAPGETVQVSMSLSQRDYSIWSVQNYSWEVVSGEYTVSVGASSRDLRSVAKFTPGTSSPHR